MPLLDPFRRFRLRSNPVPTLPPSSEEDSDASSPERPGPHIIHIPAPKNQAESLLSIPECAVISRGAPEKLPEAAHITLALDAHRPARPYDTPTKSGLPSVPRPTDGLLPAAKSSLVRRVTSKLTIAIPQKSSSHNLRSRPSTRTLPADMAPRLQGPRPTRATIALSPSLPNSFVSKQHREAALRERGLLPPKDLSEQEREADERIGSVPSPLGLPSSGLSEAERLKASWLAVNRTSESSESDCGPPAPPYSHGTDPRSLPLSSSPPPPDPAVLHQSAEGKIDPPPAGRPSVCSSAPPLSASSYLEVLHEDPSEQPLVTPPPPLTSANLPIIVSTTPECLPSPVIVESPTSCTFSSHWAGSSDSQSQSDHLPPVPEKENVRSSPSGRRRSDGGDRGRRVMALPGPGSRSLSNLRRSVVGSLRFPSSTTLSSADHSISPTQAPRTAISPTIHSIGSILRETRHIADVESRRLSELAFLD